MNGSRLGTCFVTAWNIATTGAVLDHRAWDRPQAFTDPVIVHGLPCGTGEANHGLRYWHAWVEGDVDGATWVATELGDGVLVVPRPLFYGLGRIDFPVGAWTVAYTVDEARAYAVADGTYGPWVDLDPRAAALDAECEA